MNEIIISFVFISLIGFCRTDMQNEINSCLDKTESDFSKCGVKVSKKWKCVMAFSGDKMFCNNIDRECCAMWDTFDCFGEAVKKKCGQTLFDEINVNQFQIQIKTEQSDRCPQLKYKSNECTKLMEEIQSETDKEDRQKNSGLGIKPESKSDLDSDEDRPNEEFKTENTSPSPLLRSLNNNSNNIQNSIFDSLLISILFFALICLK